ncbi:MULTISPECIES: benzoate/H(+) symporter BenE family transporter [Agrobacterium tumefaciens complex]|uniref:benzoate/H(+) symporter BenE family transporter n=1 Tax=Agrobacterium tumefaciens TaxID=358 RepID=UPI000FE27F48|nr:benzoate/H(+) symporter BenE family transporter [Agrobacterium tumefaciens]QAA98384.1 benzoate transporter [Agrobacterium tumefaciens]QAB01091.1 benzoate transporter [Agrobacterium tumefaciens]
MNIQRLPIAADLSLSAVLAGVVATLIAYAGPLVIVFQAAQGLSPALLQSWVWAISIGSGVLGLLLSLHYRVPLVIAWSVPGSALLITLLPTVGFAEAVGAYLIASLVTCIVGMTGTLDLIFRKLPAGISAAMLAGILFGFAAKMFYVLPAEPFLVGTMFTAFFLGRRWLPRYAIVIVLIVGCMVTVLGGKMSGTVPTLQFTLPTWTSPQFDWHAIINIALPLTIVGLTGQWVPGMAVIRSCGYSHPNASPLIAWSSLVSALLAPFGCHGLNLATFTAAICTGEDAHRDPSKRYIAGVSGSLLYIVLGSFSATVLSFLAMLPKELIAALAGLALFPTIANSLAASMADTKDRDASLVTFVVSASGMSLFGLGAAFWGLFFGIAAHFLLHWHPFTRLLPKHAPESKERKS